MQNLALNIVGLEQDYIGAHEHCSQNRAEVECSALCGCFSCAAVFPSSVISRWNDRGRTALCPKCGVDAVIGAASGYPITPEFLAEMKEQWFRAGGMNHSIAQSRCAFVSFVCTGIFWLLLFTGAFRVEALAILTFVSGFAALLVAIGALIWDRNRQTAVVAIVISVLGTLILLSFGD